MGGPSGSVPAPETTAQTLQDYAKYIPGAISATAQASPQIAESQLASTQATQPGYNALNLQQAQDYAVPLAQVGQNVQNSNTLAGSSTVGQQIAGPGGAAAEGEENGIVLGDADGPGLGSGLGSGDAGG